MAAGPARLLVACGRQLLALTLDRSGRVDCAGAVRVDEVIQFAATARGGERVYLACSDGGIGRPGERHALAIVDLDGPGRMIHAGSLTLPQRPLHLAVDETQGCVHLAFNLPSAYARVSLDAGGRPVAIEQFSRDPQLVGWFAHQVLPFDGTGRVLLACRGEDGKATAPEKPGSLRLLALEEGQMRVAQRVAPDGGFGFGPRNCAASPDGRFLYVVLERQNRLAVFPVNAGRLAGEPDHEVTTLSPSHASSARQLAGDICLHPTGRFVYVLNRSRDPGGESSVAVFAIQSGEGRPHHVETKSLPGRHPRTVRLTADGSWMAVALMEPDETRAQPSGVSLLQVGSDGRLSHRCHWPAPGNGEPVMWAGFREPSQ